MTGCRLRPVFFFVLQSLSLFLHSAMVSRASDQQQTLTDQLASKPRLSCLIVLAIATLILLIRKPECFLNPQFWAEDGPIFFLQQYEQGARAVFQPYAGYLLLVPRLVALFADTFFPYSAIPFVYNYSSLALTLGVAASVFSPRLRVGYKPLIALTIVLIPHYLDEVFLNITNIQWILAIALMLLVLKEKPNPEYGKVKLQIASDLLTVILCGLTGPFSILLMPFFIWKWLQHRTFYTSSLVLTAAAVALIQLSFVVLTGEPQEVGVSSQISAYSNVLGYRIFSFLFLGQTVTSLFRSPVTLYNTSHYVLTAAYFGTLLAIVKAASFRRRFISLCLGLHCVMLLTAFYRCNAEGLVSPGSGARYLFIPLIMLVWALIPLLETIRGKQKRWVQIVLILVLFSSLTSRFQSKMFVDYNWQRYSQLIGKEDVTIPLNPKGWQMHVRANKLLPKKN
jgi:hypothetical protein